METVAQIGMGGKPLLPVPFEAREVGVHRPNARECVVGADERADGRLDLLGDLVANVGVESVDGQEACQLAGRIATGGGFAWQDAADCVQLGLGLGELLGEAAAFAPARMSGGLPLVDVGVVDVVESVGDGIGRRGVGRGRRHVGIGHFGLLGSPAGASSYR